MGWLYKARAICQRKRSIVDQVNVCFGLFFSCDITYGMVLSKTKGFVCWLAVICASGKWIGKKLSLIENH